MKRFLKFRNIGFLLLAVVIALTTIVSVNTSGGPGVFTNILTALSKPLVSVATSVVRTFESVYGYMYEYDKVVAENQQLKAELAKLQQDYREYTEIAKENARLRELFNLSARHADFKYETATIIAWSASNWSSAFTISKGATNSSVKAGDPVITETGALVGYIKDVGPMSSTCVTVLDTTFSAGAVIDRNNDVAVAMGDFALMREGLLKLDYLTDSTQIVAGDTITTSGKGGVLPAGLVIGTVEEVRLHESGIRRYAVIAPAVELDSLINVFVITSFEIAE
jgi:rod shape-determining protein MreC